MAPRFLLILCALLSGPGLSMAAPAPASEPPGFEIAPPSDWVRIVIPDPAPSAEPPGEGVSYVLVDQQENLSPRASYYHEARRITSDHGVQTGSAITVSFDPSYQQLTFHHIRVLRGATASARLDRSQIKLFQREAEMESFLYDGAFTAQCQLEDVRVGDVIDFAYTIAGANPVLKDRYFSGWHLQWSVPVHRQILRVIHPAARQLHNRLTHFNKPPRVTTRDGRTEWLSDEADVPARREDPSTPIDYNPFGRVQFTEFGSWAEVVAWALPLYAVDGPLSPELEAEITRLQAVPAGEERILATLRFVQEEIRYLGIESGVGSHQPTAPGEVLRRRFGDCKDKTLLLATLLRRGGVEATPALVSTNLRTRLPELLPSPGSFNHVILHLELDHRTYWLDATRTGQRGPLAQHAITPFGYALILSPATTDLTPCVPSPESLPRKTITETYEIAAPGKDASLRVVTKYWGGSAEATRREFDRNTPDQIQKDYLEFYARRFPKIRSARAVEYTEQPRDNACVVQEDYIIPALWQLEDDKKRYELELYPTDVADAMGTPGSAERTDPLSLAFPVNVTQVIHAHMFVDWPLTPGHDDIDNAFFHFRHEGKGSGRDITLMYAYETRQDRVPPAEVAAYDAARRKAKDSLGYTLTHRTAAQVTVRKQADPKSGHGQFNWPIAVLYGVVVLFLLAGATGYYLHCRRAAPLPPLLFPSSLQGLGGWLILVGFGLYARPLSLIFHIATLSPTVFQMETWRNLTLEGSSAYHPLWLPLLLFELFYNTLLFIYSLLLLMLFLRKRRAWPACFIGLFVLMGVGLLIDSALGSTIPAVITSGGTNSKELFQAVLGACIWIPYALKSERVKATFRR